MQQKIAWMTEYFSNCCTIEMQQAPNQFSIVDLFFRFPCACFLSEEHMRKPPPLPLAPILIGIETLDAFLSLPLLLHKPSAWILQITSCFANLKLSPGMHKHITCVCACVCLWGRLRLHALTGSNPLLSRFLRLFRWDLTRSLVWVLENELGPT